MDLVDKPGPDQGAATTTTAVGDDRSGVPFSYSMVYRRNSAGLWALAPSALTQHLVPEPVSPAEGPR